ncbi:hypothetical protein MPHL21000_16990 [Mycolicibacterium phlei DSM 43239 = CCUG 21000]|uniref:Uncharacterized protein n=1 Tax=Mycolicibacterium phlei DSM 43239 = CCUG 21000 TaxID=1226750 RepID=A0A5N5UXL0_MYCPH|nr:hypothetical protein MPHL21000_16990 [Mycolicibacterium phlei DSM 43239 = CCUG 21000]
MGFHADGVDDGVGTAPICVGLDDLLGVLGAQVDEKVAVGLGAGEPFVDEVDADHLAVLAMCGDAAGHGADRAEAEDDEGAAVGDVGVLDGLPGGGQHVGQVHVAVVGPVVGDLDVGVLGLRDAQVLGLAAGDLAVEGGVAEQGRAGALVAVLGGFALALQAVAAHEAVAAGDVEGDDRVE